MSQKQHGESKDVMVLITELDRRLHEKFDDQLFIIEQQRDRIDCQQQQINDQRVIIEELTWQIRDLTDSVRKCSEIIHRNDKNMETNRKINVSEANKPQTQSNHVESETSPIYESINFDAPFAIASTNGQCSNKNKLQRQMAIGDDDNNGRSDLRTVSPISSPPPSHDDDDTEPIQISSKTFEKLNELYEMRQFVHSGSDRENYYDLDDVVYRVRQFKDYTTCRNRGSSKTLCSLISNVDIDYLPRVDEEDNEVNSQSTYESEIEQRATNGASNFDESCKIAQNNNVFTENMSNDEVYI